MTCAYDETTIVMAELEFEMFMVLMRNTPAFEGHGSTEGRCLLCSGIYGRAAVVSPCSSHCVRYNHSQAQF
ncbi:hypothetical protein NC653_014371 [Populus alba x Populus x berolinensis]|uniref:Uncharacterized protein n=1 Tax=Populus alba x Populus x berolinensis TaxID=444605 RepID=A0AAD6QWU2_9ROSI|nr:hypothetical protein NC653_014371 [Populus alba x Populus x berolinensis]